MAAADFPGVRWRGHWVAPDVPEFVIDPTSVGSDLPPAEFSRAQFRRVFDRRGDSGAGCFPAASACSAARGSWRRPPAAAHVDLQRLQPGREKLRLFPAGVDREGTGRSRLRHRRHRPLRIQRPGVLRRASATGTASSVSAASIPRWNPLRSGPTPSRSSSNAADHRRSASTVEKSSTRTPTEGGSLP